MSSPFDEIENAPVSGTGNWVRPGRYEAEIVAVKLTQKYTKEQFLAIEMVIRNVLDNDDGAGHKVGEDVTHLMKVANASFLGNVKQFISTTLACDPGDVDQAAADKVTSADQPMAGLTIAFNARQIKTQAGNPFTKVTYLGQVEA